MLPTIDRAIVITTSGRWPASYGMVHRQLKSLGVTSSPAFGTVPGRVPRAFRGAWGAWSHRVAFLQVVEAAIADGVGTLAIFEDDAILTATGAASLARFDPPADWEILYFGFQAVGTGARNRRLSPTLLRLGGVMATHACLYRADVLPKLLDLPADRAIDQAIADVLHPEGRCYACWPMVFVQAPGVSQITGEMGGEPSLWADDGVR